VGAPEDIEAYIQERGRPGRDGLPANAMLHYKSSSLQYVNEDMKAYCLLTTCCCRKFLFNKMEGYSSVGHCFSFNKCDNCTHTDKDN
jgi:superfamily II DNA helicase RecQ